MLPLQNLQPKMGILEAFRNFVDPELRAWVQRRPWGVMVFGQ